eukprot:superscaffoldBa00002998_g15848
MSTQLTQSSQEKAYISLMRGLTELDFNGPSVPCDLVLIGDHAFPLVMNSRGQVLMAASMYGRGRIVVLGHESYLTTFPALVENALTWLRGDGSENLAVGVHKNVKGVADNLSRSSFQAKIVEAFSNNLKVGVYVTDAYSVGADAKDLVAFLKAGGGVLIAGQAWHWATENPKENTISQFPGNKVSGVAGIYFSTHYGEVDILPVYPQIPSSWMALATGKDFEDDLEFLLKGVLVHGPLAFPIGTTKDRRAFLAGAYYGHGRVIVVAHECLLSKKTLASFWNNAITWLDQGRKGVVGVEPNLSLHSKHKCEKTNFRKDLSVFVCDVYSDKHVKEIHDFVAEGGGLLIGGHAWWWAQTHEGQNPMTEFLEKMQVWNLWGGLIYLVAPPNTQVEGVEVTVQTAVRAPYYKSGVTTAADWSLLRTAQSPWAELEFDNIVLTVPSHVVRDLDRPDEVAGLWDSIMKGIAELAVIPHKFARKERIVADVQISAGKCVLWSHSHTFKRMFSLLLSCKSWMHSGYPIMMHSSIAAELVRPDDARIKGLWGETHELGHNQQRSCWEFKPHTTEATCNLWSVYVHEEVLGLNRSKAHPSMTLTSRKNGIEEYVKGGKKLSDWTVWVALETYMQLQEKFGWDAFKKVFAAYHKMSNFPQDNKGKMNLYAETFSQTVEMNLSGFFKAWGWPIETATEEKLSNLPPWSDHPMIQYG